MPISDVRYINIGLTLITHALMNGICSAVHVYTVVVSMKCQWSRSTCDTNIFLQFFFCI